MKRARTLDYWRRIYDRESPVELISLSFEDVPVIGSIEIPLGRGVTAITGLNGAGKSTLLHAIWLCLSDSASLTKMALDTRLTDGAAVLKCNLDGDSYEIEYAFSTKERQLRGESCKGTPPTLEVVLIDTAELIPNLQRFVRQQKNMDDFIEQVDSYTLSPDELDIARYVSGRNYASVDVYEAELGFDERGAESPYFRVAKGPHSYGSEHLGLGELSGLFLYWTINRLPPKSVLLIDEPESFLAAHSQCAISDLIAFATSERTVACVMTSHSNDVTSQVPASRRIITMMNTKGLSFTTAEESPHHLSAIGIRSGIRLIVVVEDAAACHFVRELISQGAPALRNSIETCWAKGASDVTSLLNGLPKAFKHLSVKFVGVLDGDQSNEGHKCDFPLLFLPTKDDPDQIAQAEATSHPEQLATSFGTKVTTVQAALDKAEGANFHDWPFVVGKELGRTHHDVLAHSLRSFVANNLSSETLKNFVERLASKEILGN